MNTKLFLVGLRVEIGNFDWAEDVPVPSVGTKLKVDGTNVGFTVSNVSDKGVTLKQDKHRQIVVPTSDVLLDIEKGILVYESNEFDWAKADTMTFCQR
jgi:hypothetical protein